MAVDVGIADLVGSLFFGGAADAAVGGGAEAAIAGGAEAAAADAAAAGAVGGAEAAAAGGAFDLAAGGAAAADAAAAGGAADLGAAAAGGVDAAAAAAAPETVAAALDAAVPEGVDIASAGSLGESVGQGAGDALSFAPTPADAAGGVQGLGESGAGAGAKAGIDTGLSSAGLSSPVSAAQTLEAGPENLNAALGIDTAAPPAPANAYAATQPSGVIDAGSVNAPYAGLDPATPGAGAGSFGSDAAATASALQPGDVSGQLAAEGGVSPTANAVSGNAMDALANAPASGSSIGSDIGSVLSSPYTKAAEIALPLGFLGYNAIKGPAPIPPQAQTAVNNAQTQLGSLQGQAAQNVPLFNQTAATDLNLANNFQISPAQAASIQTWKQNQYNQLLQQIANQGNTSPMSSSEWVQGKNQIDEQALAQQTQMVTQLISTAFQASTAANAGVSTSANVSSQLDATLMQAANLQVQQDQNFQNAIGSAMQAFGLIAALQGGKISSGGNVVAGA